jgi:RNA polymerase sigma-70 factor (ECF subfamily)
MLPTSQSLLDRIRDSSDQEAWRRLLNVYEPWLRGWLHRHELQPADVEDVLQEILVAINKSLPNFVHNGQPGAFRKWLRTILTNQVRYFLRGNRNRQSRFTSPPNLDWLEQLEDADSALTKKWDREHDQQLVRRMLANLQPEFNAMTWQAFQLLVLEDQPAGVVAQRLNMTCNAVYVAKSRILSRLRTELRGLMEF